jgi:predicted metalloendopeptidase
MSISELNKLTNEKFDWINLVNLIYRKLNSSIQVSSSELVIISDPNYFKNFTSLLEKTPKRVVANFIGWIVARYLGYLTNAKFRANQFEFYRVFGIKKERPLWENCVGFLETNLRYPINRIYIDKAFTIDEKKTAVSVFKDLKESFRDLVTSSDWLDEISKEKSLLKLDKIVGLIGYPNWILSDEELDKLYNMVSKRFSNQLIRFYCAINLFQTKNVNQKNSFENVLTLYANQAFNMFDQLGRPVDQIKLRKLLR